MIDSLELKGLEEASKIVARAELIVDLHQFINDVDDINLVETDTIEKIKLNAKALAYQDVILHLKTLNNA